MTSSNAQRTMRVLEVASLQGPAGVRVADRPVPVPPPGHALVRVRAAGLNFADTMMARARYLGGPKPPYVAGLEACGEIVALGDSAGPQPFAIGARVMGYGAGAFAEYVSWPARALLPLPSGWSETQGAAFPVQWLTAHGCLRICGRLEAGETVLVHAAAGGVGRAAIRLAKHFGARVIATASTADKLEIARRHGADDLINYQQEDFVAAVKRLTGGRGVDLVLEMVGGDTFAKNIAAVVPYGRIVVFGVASAQPASVSNAQLVFNPVELIGYHLLVMAQRRSDLYARQMAEISELIASGVATPEEPRTYPLADGARAFDDLESRRSVGKLVLVL